MTACQQGHQQLIRDGLQPHHNLRHSLLSLFAKKTYLSCCICGKTGTHGGAFLLTAGEMGGARLATATENSRKRFKIERFPWSGNDAGGIFPDDPALRLL
ncbi:MAG TPA: hypothetical protein DIT89_00755 [Planctomycetaceae bacterium]|nr:hypothetical protein [Planctomycetaceae bacterium]